MAIFSRSKSTNVPTPLDIQKAIIIASNDKLAKEIPQSEHERLAPVVDAIQKATIAPQQANSPFTGNAINPISSKDIARIAAQNLAPQAGDFPESIETQLNLQGINWAEPFSPGTPLRPFYGYNKRPRNYNYTTGRNTSTEIRHDRIPFETLDKIITGYDVAQICIRYIINDMVSFRPMFLPMDGWEDNAKSEIQEAKRFFHKPDNVNLFHAWLTKWMWDIFKYDAGALYKQRNKAGKLISLKVIDGTTIAPMVDYFGDQPTGGAPAYQQFIMGVPWDWISANDLVYQPKWPVSNSPYGMSPIESVLINANTDVRLQLYFLQFFTAGTVPEAFLNAPADMSDPDGLRALQEYFDAMLYGNQEGRHGVKFLPNGSSLQSYKPTQFDPEVAEYVLRRTVAAFNLVPHNLGFTNDVNRASGDTQMDVQDRISSTPNVVHFTAILNDILQNELDLPVQIKFDTGREKEDRLIEAQAHQLYVSMGAESPDEVRENVLALPVNKDERVPRFYTSRTGPVPLSALIAVAGNVNPETGAPFAGSVIPQSYIWPGMQQPDPTEQQSIHTNQPPHPDHKLPYEAPNAQPTRTHGEGGNPNYEPPSPLDPSKGGYEVKPDNQVTKEVYEELKAFERYVKNRIKNNGSWRQFDFKHLDSERAKLANSIGETAFIKAGGANLKVRKNPTDDRTTPTKTKRR